MNRCQLFCGLLWFLIAVYGPLANAAEVLQSSRSAGKMKLDQTVELGSLLAQREPVTKARPSRAENYAASAGERLAAGIANRHDQLFSVFEADVRLVSDLDYDGFHHALNVVFDVDVSHDSATVYAKLYLSREGEPWSQYYTTDLFQIHDDDAADAYEVETELVAGYLPGYYAVLVEIYSLDHAFMVADELLDYHYLGRDLAIESLDWEERDDGLEGEFSVSVGAGSMASLPVLLLLLQCLMALRCRRRIDSA